MLAHTSRETRWNKEDTLFSAENATSGKFSIFGLVDNLKDKDPGEVAN